MNLSNADFTIGATAPKSFVRDGRAQIAFAGRSNVGKSSVINCLLNRKNFARVGSAPGKTSQINYFLIDRQLYLVDLPGYGYAKVSKAERERWGRLMEAYFASGLITQGVQIVDARHSPTADDRTMMRWFRYIAAVRLVAQFPECLAYFLRLFTGHQHPHSFAASWSPRRARLISVISISPFVRFVSE